MLLTYAISVRFVSSRETFELQYVNNAGLFPIVYVYRQYLEYQIQVNNFKLVVAAGQNSKGQLMIAMQPGSTIYSKRIIQAV